MNRVLSSVLGLLLALSLLPTARPAEAQTLETILDLAGEWRFEVGDDPAWSGRGFDDSRWERVYFPGKWEDQGFPGYDGYAWARKSFTAPAVPQSGSVFLRVGKVDDVDEVYLNGVMVGYTGELPPHYTTAYGVQRQYSIASSLIRWGQENVIAVRMYDSEMEGGIVAGPLGLALDRGSLRVQYPIVPVDGKSRRAGKGKNDSMDGEGWRFRSGDDPAWANPGFDDRDWTPVAVPLLWDAYGLKDYDGFGWYRVRFRTPDMDVSRSNILILGQIDDADEVYLNGSLVGRTGRMPPGWKQDNSYREVRAYTIPGGRMTPGAENVLAVRVYDGWLHGGIYGGPVGFVTRDQYVAWSRETRPKTTVLHRLMEFFSGDDTRYEPRPAEPGSDRRKN